MYVSCVLTASFVDEAHFGGFLTRSDVEFAEGKSNTRQEWIERMIAESKKKKAEKFQQQEEAARLTQDLDDKWKGLTSMLKSAGAIYTKRLTNADEGQADVQGGGDAVKGSSSSKVDDYNSLMRELSFQPKRATAQERLKTDEEIIKEEKDRLEKLEADRLRRMNGGEERPDQDEDEEDDEDDDDDDEDEEDDDEEDGFSDLDEDDDDDGPKAEPETAPTGGGSAESKAAAMEKAGKEIPFTFDAPEEYEDLEKHLKGLCPKDKGTVVHRMIKCNHPQFAEANKAKMELLFKFLLQHIHDSCCPQGGGLDDDDCLETVEAICPYLYDLIKFNPAPCAKAVLGVIKEKYEQYCSNPKASPTLDTVSRNSVARSCCSHLMHLSDLSYLVSFSAGVFQDRERFVSHLRLQAPCGNPGLAIYVSRSGHIQGHNQSVPDIQLVCCDIVHRSEWPLMVRIHLYTHTSFNILGAFFSHFQDYIITFFSP